VEGAGDAQEELPSLVCLNFVWQVAGVRVCVWGGGCDMPRGEGSSVPLAMAPRRTKGGLAWGAPAANATT
jgi:hypothetical protein